MRILNKLIFFAILMNKFQADGQAFNLNTFFTEPHYAFYSSDSNNYLLNESKTQATLNSNIQSMCKLPTGSFYNALNKITYTGNKTYLTGLHNQAPGYDTIFKECKLDFTYSNINSSTYSFFVNSLADTNTAFLIMPGTGTFESLKIAEGNSGDYHNMECKVKDLLRQKGDVYVYVRVNEEFRSIWKNYNNSNNYKRLSYDILDPYTKFNGFDWQDNLFSEINVWVKYLKSKYNKVIIMGLSAGGWPVLFSSLQIKPDACILASGFSAAAYDPFYLPNNVNSTLNGVLSVYTMDSLRKTIRTSNTEYLFTYGAYEGGGNGFEYNNHALQDSLQKPTTSPNINFGYFIGYHTFHCQALDTFINRILLKPKSYVNVINSICPTDSILCKIKFTGQKPYTFNLYRDSFFFQTYYSLSDSLILSLHQSGTYQIRDLHDSGTEIGYNSELINIKINDTINFKLTDTQFICDSNKTKLSLKISGTPPYVLNYNFNSINSTILCNDSIQNLYFPNGIISFNTITDSNLCFRNINSSYIINETPININSLSSTYICDSNKSSINFSLLGKSPWQINYSINNVLNTISNSNSNFTTLFNNGTYNFISISDSNNCTKQINQIVTIDNNPLSYSISNPFYNCDSNKSKIHFELQGNSPWTIYYQKNSISQLFVSSVSSFDKYFDNGDFSFDSIKDATCSKIISPAIQHYFYYNPISFQTSNPTYICDSNKAKINFTLQGNQPFTISYTQNGVANQFITSQNTIDKYYNNSIYNFSKIKDATQCELNFNILKNVDFDTLGYQISNPIYNCDSNKSKIHFTLIGNSPWTIYYQKNNTSQSFTSTISSFDKYFDNGNYQFDSIKDFSCLEIISPTIQHSFNYTPANASLSTQYFNCDSNKTTIDFSLQGAPNYTVFYSQNGFLNSFNSTTNNSSKLFNNGVYYFINSVDANGCNANINQVKTFNYQPLNYNFSNPIYDCDSNKTKINISLTGNSPWTIYYRLNNVSQTITTINPTKDYFFNNGFYEFDSVTDATCVKSFNASLHFNFNYNPISISSQNPIYDCDSNKTLIQFNINGNAPYTINYTKNGYVNNITTSSNLLNQLFTNGYYYFFNVTDNTNCVSALNQLYNIDYDTLNYLIDFPTFDCDLVKTKFQFHLQGNAPWTVFFRKDNIQNSFTTSNPNHSILVTNGTFNFDSLTDATCSKVMNPLQDYIINNSLLNVIMDTPIYDCNINKVKVHFQFQGNAPWKIHYFKIGVPTIYSTLTTYANNYDAYFNTGNYIIDSITDNSNCAKVYNTYVNNDFNPIGYQKTGTIYNCDSNKTQINYHFNGDAPWTISILNTDSNIVYQAQTIYPNTSIYLNNGNYIIQSVTDYKCTATINDTLHLNVPKLVSTISSEAVSCDSNKMFVIINATSGNAPYTYKYFQNNILQNKFSYSSTDTFYLENGAYFFEKMSDSIGCEVVFNKNVIVEYNPFYFHSISNKYNCEKDSTLVSFDISNYEDVFVQYTKDNSTISSIKIPYNKQDYYFSNGNYLWLNVMDSIGCIKEINQQININNEPIGIKKDSLIKDCENREYTYQYSFDGKSPWKLNYNKNNIFNTEIFMDTINNWTVPFGKYYFINVIDSNLCSIDILRQDTLIQFLSQNPVIEFSNNILTATHVPYVYTWYKDNVIIPNETKNKIRPYGNGVYSVSVVDSAGCLYYSNKIIINYPEEINLYPNPSNDKVNILVNGNFGEYWEYTIHDMFGNQVGHEVVSTPFKEINISHLAQGVYHFMINYSEDFVSDKHIIRFIKN